MALSFTKSWSASDDGSSFAGSDIGTIQSDISSQACDLASDQTITGVKTFSNAPKVDTVGGTLKVKVFSVTKTFSDFSAAAVTKTLNLITLPAKTIIFDAFVYLTTLFSGGGSGSYYIQVGDTTDVDGILDDNDAVNGIDVFTGAATGFRCTLLTEKGDDFTTFFKAYVASELIVQAKATCDVNLNLVTAGSITFYLIYAELQ